MSWRKGEQNQIPAIGEMARDGEWIRKLSTYNTKEREKKYNEITSCFTCYFFMGSTQQDFVQNERSKEEIQRDESLLVSSKK